MIVTKILKWFYKNSSLKILFILWMNILNFKKVCNFIWLAQTYETVTHMHLSLHESSIIICYIVSKLSLVITFNAFCICYYFILFYFMIFYHYNFILFYTLYFITQNNLYCTETSKLYWVVWLLYTLCSSHILIPKTVTVSISIKIL